MDYDVYMHDIVGLVIIFENKPKIIENGVRMKNLLSYLCWRIYRLIFIQRFYISTFGFILLCWTMMFLCILL